MNMWMIHTEEVDDYGRKIVMTFRNKDELIDYLLAQFAAFNDTNAQLFRKVRGHGWKPIYTEGIQEPDEDWKEVAEFWQE